jgi:hypothetical protein
MADLRPIARAVGRSTSTFTVGDLPAPPDAAAVLRLTERTLAQTIESLTGAMPELEVIGQGRLQGPLPSWLSPPLSTRSSILTRATSYRMGAVRLSRNLAYVDLGLIDPTLAALLETKQLNLGQLFVDPRIEKRDFEFGTQEDAGELDPILRRFFEANGERLQPYAWRRYSAAIDGVVKFVVIEALPLGVWDRVLENVATSDRGPER